MTWSFATLAIPLAFILLAALLCWQIIGTKGSWRAKLAAIVFVPMFGLAVWASMPSYFGWPTSEGLPDKGLFVWADVREPDQRTGDKGVIYVWLVPMDDAPDGKNPLGYAKPKGAPRAYVLPYSRRTHEMMERAKRSTAAGRQVVIEPTENGSEGDGEPGDAAGSGEPGSEQGQHGPQGPGRPGTGTQGDDIGVRAYELPPPALPPKNP